MPIDQDDPVFAEQAVRTAVVDIFGDVELGRGGGLQVLFEAGGILELSRGPCPGGPRRAWQ